MQTKELSIPIIYEQREKIGYGGNQEWFEEKWAQKAGCASVLASNLYAYYHHSSEFQKSAFLEMMTQMFVVMKPGPMGYPFLYKFARTFVKVMAQDQMCFQPVYQKKSKSPEQAWTFVKTSIDEGHPVAMLILTHQAPELKDDNWHWICLSGYVESEDGVEIIFSDCGQRRLVARNVLFDTHVYNVFQMVRMKES